MTLHWITTLYPAFFLESLELGNVLHWEEKIFNKPTSEFWAYIRSIVMGGKKPMVLPWCWGIVYIVATLYILMQKCSKRCSLTAWKAVIFAWSVDRRISVKGHARHLSQCKRPMFIASNSFSNPSPNPLYNHLTLPKSLIWLPNIFPFHTKARQQVSHQALLLKGWLRFLGEESVLPLRWPGQQN